jgi:ABC-2 type transport system ATP-binding protein
MTATTQTHQIRIEDLHFGYRRKAPLYTGLNLTLEPGRIYGLLGRNGSGKTTLLRLMAGLLNPWQGSIETWGYPAFERHPAMLEEICFIPEEWGVPDMKIGDLPKLMGPFYPRFDERLFWHLIDEFEVPQHGKITGSSLGQKKKAILAFGLATKARLLILDEPTNGLDIPSKSKFRKMVSSGIQDDICMIISTHQVRDMVNLIDPLIILENGKIIFQEELMEVSRKLVFKMHQGLQPPSDVIYAERVPGGYLTVAPNTKDEDSDVDLEVLFNTIIQYPQEMAKMFNDSNLSL